MYDLETFKKDRAVPYCSCIYKLRKISDKINQKITEKENQKHLYDCIVFKGSGRFNEMLDHVLSYKGEAKKFKNKIVDYFLYMTAQNGSESIHFCVKQSTSMAECC